MFSRVRQILMVGGIESLGVVLSGIAGLLIVNVLAKDQYAAYTFLVACMTLMLGITDTGLAHCCLPVVGQRAREVPWVAAACEQVFRKRWWLLFAGFFIVVPYWFFSNAQYGWSGPAYWLASALIVAVLLFTLREHYGNTVLMILGHISTLNRNAMLSHGVRITLVCAALALPLGAYQLTGVVGATAAAALVAMLLSRRALTTHEVPDARLPPDEAQAVDKQIYKIAKPLVLPAVFYQFQGIITVFIVSLFGTADMLADVGAFGRLSMILMVFDRVAAVLLFPAIARAADGERLLTMVVRSHMLYLGLMTLVCLSAILLPQYWMLLLGSQYKDRESLVWMAFLATLLMNSAGFAFRTIAARGYTVRQTYIIPFVLLLQVVYLWVFGAKDLPAVLGFNVVTCLANFLYQYAMLAGWFVGQKRQQNA